MALHLREITLRLHETEEQLPAKIAARLHLDPAAIGPWKIVRKGIDARKKPDVLRVYTVEFSCPDEEEVLRRHAALVQLDKAPASAAFTLQTLVCRPHVVVAGMGPAGLFAALTLAEAGARVTLIERGRPVAERLADVRQFWAGTAFNPHSNIQFGEGGAGTFSDGKLTSRSSSPLINHVLKRLVEFGAPQEILYQSKAHIGSDRLRKVVIACREHLVSLGVDIRFSCRLTDFEFINGELAEVTLNDCETLACDRLILATGHSARDTYELLNRHRFALEAKAFAIGLRVEHPLELINQIQYGRRSHPQLPAADYRLAWNNRTSGRGVYSFCMCPGGVVVNASSEPDHLVVNGMSDFARNAPRSNSALVVSVTPADFGGTDVLAGIRFQRTWEHAAYVAGGSNWFAPAQPLLEFLDGRQGKIDSSCQPGVSHVDLSRCLPAFVTSELRQALPQFNRKMPGFVTAEATLIGVETRTSAPLRMLRDERGESLSHKGVYPAGEGAGYAGGIMSAAVDGIRIAQAIVQSYQ